MSIPPTATSKKTFDTVARLLRQKWCAASCSVFPCLLHVSFLVDLYSSQIHPTGARLHLRSLYPIVVHVTARQLKMSSSQVGPSPLPKSSPPSPPPSPSPYFTSIPYFMASSEVDQKFLGLFARNIASDNPLLSSTLFKLLGLSVILTKQLVKARKLRKLDPTRQTKSLDLYFHILWLAREGLVLVEQYVLYMVASFEELKVLSYKLRASFYHIFVLFHNNPSINQASPAPRQITTPPGLVSPRAAKDKGKAPATASLNPSPPESRSSSVQPSHPLEGGPVQYPTNPQTPIETENYHNTQSAPGDFLIPFQDYIPHATRAFEDANALAVSLLWGSHPLRLSVRSEYCAFLYDCCKEYEKSRQLAKTTIAEVYNATEGMDDEMFEDAAEIVGVLGRMMKRGLGSSSGSNTTVKPSEPPRPLRSTPPRQENMNLRAEAKRQVTPTRGGLPQRMDSLSPEPLRIRNSPNRVANLSPAVTGAGMENPI